MKTALWLAWRELTEFKARFVISASVVAMAVSLSVTVELVSIARNAAVAKKIDYMGPAILVIPAGLSSLDLARDKLGDGRFSKDSVSRLRGELSGLARALDGRLLAKTTIRGEETPVIGVSPADETFPPEILSRLDESSAAAGAALAERFDKNVGDRIISGWGDFAIIATLPARGTGEDISLFLPLKKLRELKGAGQTFNEIRIFPEPGTPPEEISALLRENHPEFAVIMADRGAVADVEMNDKLNAYRWAIQAITALAVAASIIIISFLNVSERRLEVATLVVVGSAASTVLFTLAMRAAIIGFIGGLSGYSLGAIIASAQNIGFSTGFPWSWNMLFISIVGTTLLSLSAAIPASLVAISRNHVATLQE